MSTNMKKLWLKYRHLVPVVLYTIFYLCTFAYVENRPVRNMHLLVSKWDRLIPFCEYFIVPYLLWFVYVAGAVLYFALVEKDRNQYWNLVTNLGIGMTLFLIVSLIYPNGHGLRPVFLGKNNIFADMVRALWRIDTATNVLPSIHVFNSVAVHIAVSQCPSLNRHRYITEGSSVLCVLIIASTMFLKQHTVIDVISALALNMGCYYLIYQPTAAHARNMAHSSRRWLS